MAVGTEMTADQMVARPQAGEAPSFRVLGIKVSAVQIPDAIGHMERWIAANQSTHYVAVTGMHGVTEAQTDPRFKNILNQADLVVPDGMPLVWLSHRHGFNLKRRVYGPELMETFCRQTGSKYRHFFYGGADGVAQDLATQLRQRSGIQIAGVYCPPFRPLTEQEQADVIAQIQDAKPDVLWVGLSTPKQERWMDEFKNRVHVPVLLGVGAAFDLNSGRLTQAPRWMRENGLEWLFRLVAEPKRLWRRYLVQGSKFAWWVGLELSGLRSFN